MLQRDGRVKRVQPRAVVERHGRHELVHVSRGVYRQLLKIGQLWVGRHKKRSMLVGVVQTFNKQRFPFIERRHFFIFLIKDKKNFAMVLHLLLECTDGFR
jgi:hypothetical protein